MPVASIAPDNGSDEYALVAGHVDSWHIGANDNAAGDATLMELARIAHATRGELKARPQGGLVERALARALLGLHLVCGPHVSRVAPKLRRLS